MAPPWRDGHGGEAERPATLISAGAALGGVGHTSCARAAMPPFPSPRSGRLAIGAAIACLVATQVRGPALGAGPSASTTLADVEGSSATGGLPDTIPLALPAAAGDLPLPIQITSSGPGERGPLGIGWALPISTVRELRDTEGFPSGVTLAPPRRLALSLLGRSYDMRVAETDGALTKLRPFDGDRSVELIEDGSDGTFRAHDEAGRTYWFERDPRIPAVGHDTLLLKRITDVTGAHRVELSYAILERLEGRGVEVLLDNVQYSFAPGTDCPKFSVGFDYLDPYGAPFSARGAGGLLWTNQHLIASIQVDAASDPGCADRRTIAAHQFTYEGDPASGLPVLRAVDGSGMDWGAPQRQATYTYGTAIRDGSLAYGAARRVSTAFLPKELRGSIGATIKVNDESAVALSLRDFTGDGRADLFFSASGALDLKLAPHAFAGFGQHTLSDAPRTLIDSLPAGYLRPGRGTAVDWNGDGRLDLVDSEDGAEWKVFLNTPAATPLGLEFQSIKVASPFYREYPIDERMQRACEEGEGIPLPEDDLDDDPLADDTWDQVDDRGSPTCDGPTGAYASPSMGFTSWTKAQMRCFEYAADGAGGFNRQPCAALPDPWTERTQWTVATSALRDVNGDGYPDYVYTSRGAELQSRPRTPPGAACPDTCPAHVDDLLGLPAACTGDCYDDFWGSSYELPEDTQLHVLLHAGPAMARPGAQGAAFTSHDILRADGACGVERKMTRRERRYSEVLCGLRDVNGDGQLDWVDGSHRGPPFSDPPHVALGNGRLGWDSLSEPQLDLPGPLELAYDRSGDCPRGGEGEYITHKVSDLVDLTGDGIPDYVFGGSPDLGPELGQLPDLQFFVQRGTGLGFGHPMPILLEDGESFLIDEAVQSCGTSPTTRLLAGLSDFDGDGRPELIRAGEDYFDLWSASADLQGSGSNVDEDRVVRVDGPTGVSKLLRYGSAKDDPVLPHQTPGPEIVLDRIDTLVSGPLAGEPPAAIELAYGDSALHFHPGAQRFVPAGFGVQLRWSAVPGLDKSGQPVRLGHGSIARTVRPGDYPGLEGVILTGSPLASEHLAGAFSETNAWQVLYGAWPSPHPLTRGGSLHDKAVHGVDWAALAPVLEGCSLVDPYSSSPPDPTPCATRLISYDARVLSWSGDVLPQVGDENVQAARQTIELDDLGRATLSWDEGDVFDPTDDVCTAVTYASPGPAFERTYGLGTPAITTISDCKGRVFSRAYVEYDGLPLGSLDAGLPSRSWTDVYRTSDGAFVATGDVVEVERNQQGVVTTTTVESSYGAEVQTKVTTVALDPFGLVPVSSETAGSDVGVILHTDLEYDPFRLLPTRRTDQDGSGSVTVYDARGRSVAKAVVRDGSSYFYSSAEYLGEDGFDPQGRRVVTRLATELIAWDPETAPLDPQGLPVPPAPGSPGLREETTFLDALGRTRFSLRPLGADYAGETQRLGYVEHDALGRQTYSVPLSLLSEDIHSARGTSYHYDERGRLSCAVEGDGPQASPTGSGAPGSVPTCKDYQYLDHRLQTGTSGPAELSAASSSYLARDVEVSTGAGRQLASYREQAGVVLSEARFGYDALGNVTTVRRAVAPELASTSWVEWRSVFDARGRVLSSIEPAAAEVHSEYDSLGRLRRTWSEWDDNGVISGEETRGWFDSLGRPTGSQVTRWSAGEATVESTTSLGYDEPCDDALQTEADHLAGRLACSFSAETKAAGGLPGTTASWFAYDGAGNLLRVHREGPDGDILTELREPGLARLESYGFELPDDPGSVERALFQYDSAGQVSQVVLTDGDEQEIVMKASYDAWLRPLSVLYGNGVAETLGYRPDQRRELLSRTITGRSWTYEWTSLASDGEGRTLQEKVHAPDGAEQVRSYAYDARDHLVERLVRTSGLVTEHERFAYDALGNIRFRSEPLAGTYQHHQRDVVDPDRLCAVVATTSPATPAPVPCEYAYGPHGEVLSTPELELSYDSVGTASRVRKGGHEVRWRGGPEGRAELFEEAGDGTVLRHDQHVGPSLTYVRDLDGEVVLERSFTGPFGLLLTKRGPGNEAPKVYSHSAASSNVLFTNDGGEAKQYVEYAAYGAVTYDTGDAGSGAYRHQQFNGGEQLAELGIQEIGARLYDPALGRFLQRDPLPRVRRASSMGPYSFASNDPINHADPSGLDDEEVDWSAVDGVPVPFFGEYLGDGYWVRRSPIDGRMEGRVLGHDWWDADQVVLDGVGPPTVDVTIVLPKLFKDPSKNELLRDLVPPGMIDEVIVAPVFPDGTVDAAQLRDEVLQKVRAAKGDRAVVGTLYQVGHGSVGKPTIGWDLPGNVGVEPIRLLLPYIVNGVTYDSCNVGYGARGEAFLQQQADQYGVVFSGMTGLAVPRDEVHDGILVSRFPGQAFVRSEAYARQIVRHILTPDMVPGGRYTSNMRLAESLMQAVEADPLVIINVYSRIVTDPRWDEVRGRLNFLDSPEQAVFWNRRFGASGVANPWGINVTVD